LQQPASALVPLLAKGKIVYPIIANECRFALDREGYFVNDKAFILPTDDIALLAVLNSKAANFYFSSVCAALEGAGDRYLEFRAQYVDVFPVPTELRKSTIRGRLSKLVAQIFALQEKLAATRGGGQQTLIQPQIHATDRQIDQLMYELYGLTDEEIAIVEGNS
jgi:hypothetical protein